MIKYNEEVNDFGIQFINLLPQDPIQDDLSDLKYRDLADLGFVVMQLFSHKNIDLHDEENKEKSQVDWQYVDRWFEENFSSIERVDEELWSYRDILASVLKEMIPFKRKQNDSKIVFQSIFSKINLAVQNLFNT